MAVEPARRTKIIATLGPSSASRDRIADLVRAGMDCARLNFSHGTHDQHAEVLRIVRAVQEEVGRPIAVMADLQGPKLRIGDLAEPVVLERGTHVDVVPGDAAVDGELPVSPSVIAEVLQPGHEILIDDGLVRLQVESVKSGRAHCAVIEGGRVTSHKGVNLPGVPVPIPSLTRKDLSDLEFALGQEVDFVALSFVRSAADVRDLRGLIDQNGSHAGVVAKVEKAEAVEALDAIVAEADVLMVARGDLGVEIGPASVPLLQKRIIVRALDNGKTVITATQMLESMVHQAEPTRAEASDVANAVLDGTSALMLSQETAPRWRTWTGSRGPSSRASTTGTSFPRRARSRRSAVRCRTRPATSRRRSAPRRSSCRRTRARPPPPSRVSGLSGLSSASRTTATRSSRWRSSGASCRSRSRSAPTSRTSGRARWRPCERTGSWRRATGSSSPPARW